MEENNKARWIAMRATYSRELKAQRYMEKKGFESYVPMRYHIILKNGKKVRELAPAIHSLIFVYGSPVDIQNAKSRIDYLQYMVNSHTKEKNIISMIR